MTQEAPATLELADYLQVLWRRKLTIIITVVVCMLAALAMSFNREDEYVANTRLLLEQRLVDRLFVPTEQQTNSPVAAERDRANEIQVMASPAVRALVKDSVGRDLASISFQPVRGTDAIDIVARGKDPKAVAKTANAYADAYVQVRTDLIVEDLQGAADELQVRMGEVDAEIAFVDESLNQNPPIFDSQGRSGDPRIALKTRLQNERNGYQDQYERMNIGISVAEQGGAKVLFEATPPSKPVNESPFRNLAAGFAIGLTLGIALAFLREYLDDTIKTKDDLEAASGLTTVGIIPAITDWKKREATMLISAMQPRSGAAEAYRTVRTSVEFLSLDHPIGSLQLTSALAAEGKTSTLANLAITFARAGQRVIVLCCDLRRPRIHEFFGLDNQVGFTSVLLGDAPLGAAIQSADPELPIGLVASGPLPPNPAELLASKRAVEVIEDLDRRCDLLLIDSPPVLPVTDALVISGLVDAVLFVANAGSSTKRGVKRSVELLHQVDAPLIGSIINGVSSRFDYGFAYGDNRYYHDAGTTDQKQSSAGNGRSGKSRSRTSARATR